MADGVRQWSWRDLQILVIWGPPGIGFAWAVLCNRGLHLRIAVAVASTIWLVAPAGWTALRTLARTRRLRGNRKS